MSVITQRESGKNGANNLWKEERSMSRHPGIYKRGDIYWLTYRWQGRQYFESSHSSDIHDAEALLLTRKTELGAGRKPMRRSETLTVDQLLDSYIAQIEHPATQKRYRLSRNALSLICGHCRITDVDAFTFDRFKEARIKQGVSPAGVNRDLALPRAAFNFAVERRMIAHSLLDGVKLFNESKHRKPPRAISFADEQKILLCCDGRLRVLVITLLDTGMRVGIEALILKWSDVDFEESIITVVQSKTAAGLRALPMTALVKSELRKWYVATKGVSEYVFFNPRRPATHIRSMKTAWHNALRVAGIPRFPVYRCRHSFATRLAGAGVSDTIIDQLLGHSRRDVLRFYTARVPEYLRDASNLLDRLRGEKTTLSSASKMQAAEGTNDKSPTLIN
jgi:integrase